jgi:hypothetical protein
LERIVFIMPVKLIMPAKFDPRVRFLRSGFFTAICSSSWSRVEPLRKSNWSAQEEGPDGGRKWPAGGTLAAVLDWGRPACRKMEHQFRDRATD